MKNYEKCPEPHWEYLDEPDQLVEVGEGVEWDDYCWEGGSQTNDPQNNK